MLLEGHVLLTGASAGIGEALAGAYAREGLRLTLVARREERLLALKDALARDLGDKLRPVHVIAADLADPETPERVVEEAVRENGPVEHLVNNAGVQIVDYGWAIDPEDGEALFRLNLLHPLRLIRAVSPGMRERGRGSIVNVASVAAYACPLGMAWYGASKAGLAAASETLHGELRSAGVHVVTVYPGPVRTDMGAYGISRVEESLGAKLQQWGTPDGLARRVIAAVKKKRARVVYPETYAAVRHLPGPVRWALDRLSPALKP